MCKSEHVTHRLLDLIPREILTKLATIPVVEAGYGAGPGFCAVTRWTYTPPITLIEASLELDTVRGRMKRCHIHFADGSRLILDRHQFLAFYPSVKLRKIGAKRHGSDGVIRERFRFRDFEEWPDTLAGDIEIFRDVHKYTPNLMAATEDVYIEMDRVAHLHRNVIINEANEHPREHEEFQISSFLFESCEVEFILTDVPGSPEYILLYDSDPTFDGEPFLVPGTHIETRVARAG